MNNFLSTNPTTRILSSLVSEVNFDKESKSEMTTKMLGVGGGGGNTETKIVSQIVKRGKIQNSYHLHNVKYVVQSTFQKT